MRSSTERYVSPCHMSYCVLTIRARPQGESFPGLMQLIKAYLETLDIEVVERKKIEEYLDLIKRRASGALQTPATWIRNFVRSHPAYKFDSVVSQEINYDLLVAVDEMCVHFLSLVFWLTYE